MRPEIQRKKVIANVATFFAVLSGIFCFIYSAILFADTIVKFTVPIIVAVMSTIVGFYYIKRWEVLKYISRSGKTTSFGIFMLALMTFGSIGTCTFLFTNRYLSFHNYEVLRFPITKHSIMHSRTYADGSSYTIHYVTFEMMAKERTTGFEEEKADSANFIDVTYRKGLWGLYVITSYKLLYP